jgi:olefin beta-lactone synthetase
MKPIEIPDLLKYGNIIEHFEWAVRKVPHKTAIIDKSKSITFIELHERVVSAQQKLRRAGLKSGDRVLVFVPMSIDLYVGVLALFRMGCTAVFLDEWSNISRLKLACQIANCQGFLGFSLSRLLGWFIGDIRKIPIWVSSRKLGQKAAFGLESSQKLKSDEHSSGNGVNFTEIPSPENHKNDFNAQHYAGAQIKEMVGIEKIGTENETALITFTTGSTGVPKAAKRTHEFLHQQFLALQKSLKTKEEVVDMPVLPIVLLINLGLGVSSVLAKWNSKKPQKMEVQEVLDRIKKFGVNRIIASPYFIERIGEYVLKNEIKNTGITQIFSGGAPVFPSSAMNWVMAFKEAEIQVVYGSTEAEPISMISGVELFQTDVSQCNGLCVGRVEEVAQVRIVNLETGKSVDSGEVGEILVSGKHVLREYFGANSSKWVAESKIFEGDVCWHRTGDAGFIGEDGKLYLVGRCTQIIEHVSEPIYPFLVEEQLKNLDGVSGGTVMKLEGSLIYFIELNEGVKLNESVRLQVEQQIDDLKLPQGQVFFLQLPRDPRHFSKIDYGKLKLMSRGC